jgi:hypothetical protein
MKDIIFAIAISPIIGGLVSICICAFYYSEPKLNFGGHFKPKRHFFFEKCSACGKRLKHFHWFWGKGDKMFCDVDYHGNTEWYCEKCDEEIHKNIPHVPPTE